MLIPIIGRACSGKSTILYEKLEACAENGKKCLLIVPEQFSFEAEKKVLENTERSAWKNIEVISFSFMAKKLIEKYDPRHLPYIGTRGKTLLMSLVLDDLWDRLCVYGKVKNRQRLVSELMNTDLQLKQACLSSELLYEISEQAEDETLAGKLHDIGLILGTYHASLDLKFSDKTSDLHALSDLLKINREYADYTIAVDDFSGFTAEELSVVEQLMCMGENLMVTFCCDDENAPSGNVFDLPRKSFRDIMTTAKKNNIAIAAPIRCERTFYRDEALVYAERYLFDFSAEGSSLQSDAVTVCKCPDRVRECEFAAIIAKKLIMEKNYRCRDIAVIERNNGSYAPTLEAAFKRHELPVFHDNRRSITCEPPVLYLLSLLENAFVGFSSDAVMRMLKSGMTDFEEADINEIDNYILMYDIDGSAWKKDWEYHPDGLGVAFRNRDKEKLEMLNVLRRRIENMISEFSESCRDKTCSEITEVLYRHLEENHIPDKLRLFASSLAARGNTDEADTVISSWNELTECLSDLHDVIGERYVSPERFFELFSDTVSSATCGVAPGSMDEIGIGAADRVRLSDVKAVILVGVNDGVFPANTGVSGIFSDNERRTLAALGAELPGDATYIAERERYVTYKAFTYARERMFISYSQQSTDGSHLLPSEIIDSMQKILPQAQYIEFDNMEPADRLSGKESAFRYLAENFLSDDPLLTGLNAYFLNSGEQTRVNALERLASKTLPSFKNPDNAKLLYGRMMRISPSKMEDYYTCAFRYFCKFGLYAKPRRKAELSAAQNGLAVHYVLQRVFDEVGSARLARAQDETVTQLAKKYTDEYISLFLTGLAEKSDRMYYIVRSYVTIIESILKRLADEFRNSRFETADTELAIGDPKNGLGAYRVIDENGDVVEIVGTVDRIDICRMDDKCYLRVVDYKTSGKEFRLRDTLHGINAQMLIYLMCLWQNGSKRYGGRIVPAGVLYVPAKIGELGLDRQADSEKIKSMHMKNAKMSGILLQDPEMLRAMGAGSGNGYLPASVDAEGQMGGALLSFDQFCRLHEIIDRKIAEMGSRLRGGDIAPLPIGGDEHDDPCRHCDYQSVCLHESEDPCNMLKYISDEELYQMLTAEVTDNG